MSQQDETLLRFPCRFPIKAMGRADDGLEDLVNEVVRRHVPEPDIEAIRTRASGQGRYLSVTAVIQATSRSQLDAIYMELTADDRVRFAL